MASRPLRPGDPRRLGDYQLIARLGEGGMGTVFLARDPAGRPVAVKAIKPEYAANEEFRARFRSEVNRAREVPSFCTAAVLAADPDSETPYLVVEYVDGPSLQEIVHERGPMSPGDLHSVAVGVAAALTAIHGAGVIHRDLKPANVLLSLGLPKVIDFGIARALEGTTQHTRPGRFVGTVDYMSPERLDSSIGAVTPAADIFAWGAVIAFAGTGRIPFWGDGPMATAAQILTKPPDLQGLPASLTELVTSALAKDPRQRPTANELLQRLLVVRTPDLLTVTTPKATPDLLTVTTPNAPAGRGRREGGRFDARDLLEQIIAENPPAPPHAVAPMSRSVERQLRKVRRPAATYTSTTTVRRLLYAVVALLVASVAGATLAYARNIGDEPSIAPTQQLQPKAAPVPSTKLLGPAFSDPLRGPGRFQESVSEAGRCTFRNARLRARVAGRTTYQCAGPADTFAGDQSITVNLALAGADACAMIWFRSRGSRGYQVTACADLLELEELDGAVLTSLGRTSAMPLSQGTAHDLSIVVTGGHATISVDGRPAVQATVANPDLASGRVQLGVTNTDAAETAEVSFANLDVRAG